jgi:hypothetical protein
MKLKLSWKKLHKLDLLPLALLKNEGENKSSFYMT